MTKWPVGLGDSGGCQGLPAHQLLTSDSQYVPHRRSTTSLIQALCDGTHGQGCIGLLMPWLPLRILVLLGNHIPTIRFQGKKGRRQNKEEKKERESITYAIYREDKSIYTAREFHVRTGNNAGRGHEASRAWAGQAQVRWNRLCSLTASLKSKAPHTQSICVTPHGAPTPARTLVPHNLKPQTTHQNSTAGPCLGIEDNKKATLQPCFQPELLFQPEDALPISKIFRIFFLKSIPTAFGLRETPQQGTHPVAPKEACTGGWVDFFFIKSLLLLSGNSQDRPRIRNSNCRTSRICSLRGEAFSSLLQSLEPQSVFVQRQLSSMPKKSNCLME